MGSIQYVNNDQTESTLRCRVCLCVHACSSCMHHERDDDDDYVYNFVHCDEML